MRMEKLKYQDDPTAQELFALAGAALADPSDTESRRKFWKFVDAHGDHPWVAAARRGAAANHPRGVSEGNVKIADAIDDSYGRKYAGQPAWLRGVYQRFERG